MPTAFALPLVFLTSVLGLGVGYSAFIELLDGFDGQDAHKIFTNLFVIVVCIMMSVGSWYVLSLSLR